jgi:hypothetical protein
MSYQFSPRYLLISNNSSSQKNGVTKQGLENRHRVWRRAHAAWHVQRHGSYEEGVALERCARFGQRFQVEHFSFVDGKVSLR